MTGSRLAALLDQATPPNGDWSGVVEWTRFCERHAPDMARLLVDMADYVEEMSKPFASPTEAALLTRFAALDEKAGGA